MVRVQEINPYALSWPTKLMGGALLGLITGPIKMYIDYQALGPADFKQLREATIQNIFNETQEKGCVHVPDYGDVSLKKVEVLLKRTFLYPVIDRVLTLGLFQSYFIPRILEPTGAERDSVQVLSSFLAALGEGTIVKTQIQNKTFSSIPEKNQMFQKYLIQQNAVDAVLSGFLSQSPLGIIGTTANAVSEIWVRYIIQIIRFNESACALE